MVDVPVVVDPGIGFGVIEPSPVVVGGVPVDGDIVPFDIVPLGIVPFDMPPLDIVPVDIDPLDMVPVEDLDLVDIDPVRFLDFIFDFDMGDLLCIDELVEEPVVLV